MMIDLVDAGGRAVVRLTAGAEHVDVMEAGGGRAVVREPEELARAVSALGGGAPVRPRALERPTATTPIQGRLLLCLAEHWLEIAASAGGAYHVTLAHALPVALDASWRRWAGRNVELLVAGGQLVAVPASDLVAVVPDEGAVQRHRRLLRRHVATVARATPDVGSFLEGWSRFAARRWGSPPTAAAAQGLAAIVAMSGGTVWEFQNDGERIGRSLVCVHQSSHTLFDLMAVWEPAQARWRPGVFSAVHGLAEALRRRLRFSLCYGRFPYKEHVVGSARRLTLWELAGAGAPPSEG
jgi:hypothetical protein